LKTLKQNLETKINQFIR